MVLCIFTTYGMMPRQIHEMNPNSFTYKALAFVWFEKWLTYITGTPFSGGHLQEIGARIFNLERMYSLRERLTAEHDTLPDRMLHEPTFEHMKSGHPLHALLPRYYKKRGWSAEGVPLPKTLDRLQVQI
jgi:aldehyde:ferredoxin oxidoreductase